MTKIALLVTLTAGVGLAETPSALAIRDARVVTVSGPTLARGTVVLRNGLIEAVGENVSVPSDAWVIDGAGLTVYPGLIDALSTWGLPDAQPRQPGTAPPPAQPAPPPAKGPEDRPSNTSWVRAADGLRPTDPQIEAARNAGFTTAVVFPTRGIFAGQGAIVNLRGERPGDMVVAPSAGLYLAMAPNGFGGGFPASSMGVIAYIRQIYFDAAHYRMAKSTYAKSAAGMERPAYDRALEGVLESPRVLLPVPRALDIPRMVRFANELKTPAIFYGGQQAYRAAGILKKSGIPLLVSLKWPERNRDADPNEPEPLRVLELRDKAPSTPAELSKADVPFAFYSDGIAAPADVLKAAKKAIDAGLSADAAVHALTLSPAQIYGVADRLGSVDKGKIANLVVARGDLFDEKTRIEYVFVDGMKFQPPAPAPPAEEAPSR